MLSGNGRATPPAALRCAQNRRLTVERIGFPLDNLCSTPLAALIYWRSQHVQERRIWLFYHLS